MTYEEWMKQVDVILESLAGIAQDELPDWLSRDAFESGMTPEEGANECLFSAGWYSDDDVVDEY